MHPYEVSIAAMGPGRAVKRVRAEDLIENFWEGEEENGHYLTIKLKSGKPMRSRGWPWVQQCIRGVLGQGAQGKVAKANFLKNGDLLLKTKNEKQTAQLLKVTLFGEEPCEVEKDRKLNMSKGTIYAPDLIELSEDEVVGWLAEFGVVAAKRFTKWMNGVKENTPLILLTFSTPTCPMTLTFDYVSYQVRKHVPNPLTCFKCGRFGHAEAQCTKDAVCLTCGEDRHDGACQPKCVNCKQPGHSCRSRECPVWIKEKEICVLKVEKDLSYAQARNLYDQTHQPQMTRTYASVVHTPAETPNRDVTLCDRVEKLEAKLDKMLSLLDKLLTMQMLTNKDANSPSILQSQDEADDLVEAEATPPCPSTSSVGVADTDPPTVPSLPRVPSQASARPGQLGQGQTSACSVDRARLKKPLKPKGTGLSTTDSDISSSPQVGSRLNRSDQQLPEQSRRMPSLTRQAYVMET